MRMQFAQPLDLTEADEVLAARFWNKVDIRQPDQCWEWMAHRKKTGYGQFMLRAGVFMTSSRVALALSIGRPLSSGECACHHCDNPPCCNPAHLFAGTSSDNLIDCVEKGRKNSALGERQASAKLTESDVREILSHSARFGLYADLGRRYGVAANTIKKIRERRGWKHVEVAS